MLAKNYRQFFKLTLFALLYAIGIACIIYTVVVCNIPDTRIEYIDIPTQIEIPNIPFKSENEISLLDKSGSMEGFITAMYKKNIQYFSKEEVWCFDTEIIKDFDIDTLNFENDTDIFKAINSSIDSGYQNIFIFSDMEHTYGEAKISEQAKDVNIYIFSPHELTEESQETIDVLCKSNGISSIYIISLNGMFE